jgi:hypothetical protein
MDDLAQITTTAAIMTTSPAACMILRISVPPLLGPFQVASDTVARKKLAAGKFNRSHFSKRATRDFQKQPLAPVLDCSSRFVRAEWELLFRVIKMETGPR